MQHDDHVRLFREGRTVIFYEFAGGGNVQVVASRGLDPDRMEWAIKRMVDMKRAELRGEWKTSPR